MITLRNKIMVNILPEVFADICSIVTQYSQEIAWWHSVKREKNVFTITNTYMTEQENGSTNVQTTAGGQHALLKIEDSLPKGEFIRCWGHSHVNMPTAPSGTDDEQLTEYMGDKIPYYVMLIANKKYQIRVDVFTKEYVATDVSFEIQSVDKNKFWKEQIAKHCKEKKYIPYVNPKYYNQKDPHSFYDEYEYDSLTKKWNKPKKNNLITRKGIKTRTI